MILAATGLKREAAILGKRSVRALAGGGDAERLRGELELAARSSAAIVSIGLGGALVPGLKPGDWVVGTRVVQSRGLPIVVGAVDDGWTTTLLARLPGARPGGIFGSDVMLADQGAKRRAHEVCGAAIVDMESHVAALVAARFGLPFAVARVVSDAADRALPSAAQAGMAADGGMDVLAVVKALATRPRQLLPLIRVGMEAETAFRALGRGLDLLGPGLGLPDFGQLPLDVA